ncbi:EF-hand, partial [Wallemia mellicola CBS 633.66]
NWFETVDRNKSGQIDAQELQMALVNGDYSNFDLDTTKMLIGIFDVDKTGTISIEEFAGVFKYINDWRNVFQHFDADRSGSIEGHELANALAQFGYRLSPFTLRVLEDKYGEGGRYGGVGVQGISFDRFIRVCVAVKTLSENFQRLDVHKSGYVNMDYELFLQSYDFFSS